MYLDQMLQWIILISEVTFGNRGQRNHEWNFLMAQELNSLKQYLI